ncbi:MAG TPA: hypothetical protein VFV34_02705 [Blastocatellia bacterium]|nr:hypothetical protein [Blastocatellia bacterium]
MSNQSVRIDAVREPREPSLTAKDREIIDDVRRALADGLQLKQWWEQKEARDNYDHRFPLAGTPNNPDRALGFFDSAPLNGKSFPVMGLVQEMLFDQPKQAPPEKVREEFREFIFHYFLRVSQFDQPDAFIGRDQFTKSDVRTELQPFSFCPERTDSAAGFGYRQLYYKRRGTGEAGRFPAHLEPRIVDMRRIGAVYDWIVLAVKILNFNIVYQPFASGIFSLVFPLDEETFVGISPDFVVNQDDPSPDVLGVYGIGYALLRPAPRKTIFAYGPGYFTAGFQTMDFKVRRDGKILARLAFVSNRPTQVLNIDVNFASLGFDIADLCSLGFTSRLFGQFRGLFERLSPQLNGLDPVMIYIRLVNLLTGGMASHNLCASLEALEKTPMLLTHFMEHYRLIVGALMTWRQVQNWLNPGEIPNWVKEGTADA